MTSTAKDRPGSRVRWLRISYWAGAVTDFLAALGMIFPDLGGALYGLRGFTPGSDYLYAMDTAAALMLGWAALLLWADRRPVERRGILVLTASPVIVGLAIGEILAVRNGFLAFGVVIPVLFVQATLAALFLFSYAGRVSGAELIASMCHC